MQGSDLVFVRRGSRRTTTLSVSDESIRWSVEESDGRVWEERLTVEELSTALEETSRRVIGGPCSSCRLGGSRDDAATYGVLRLGESSVRLWHHEIARLRARLAPVRAV